MASNALGLLSAYGTDSDSEDDVPGPKVSVKRCFLEDDTDSHKVLKISNGVKLPVPAIFQKVPDSNSTNQDHGGRIRNYPHERGNWSTYIYIPYGPNDVMSELISEIISVCKPEIQLQPAFDLHISLTRTIILRHHWIDSFVKTIAESISHIGGFLILFDKLKVYCNDERTRTFIGIQIKTGHSTLESIVQILDKCLNEFNLPAFYKDPSFHMSLVWCVGDYEEMLNNFLQDLNKIVDEYMTSQPQSYWYINVKNLLCKTGNKMFNFNLSSTTYNTF